MRFLRFKVSDSDLASIRAAARAAGLSPRRWVRELALAASTGGTVSPRLDERERVLAVAMSKLGAREHNSTNQGPEIEEIVHAAEDAYQRYWVVLTREGRARYEHATGSPGMRVLELATEDRRYFMGPPAWCGLFVSWALAQVFCSDRWWRWQEPLSELDGHPFGQWFGGAGQIREWGEAHGVWIPAENTGEAHVGSIFVTPGDTHVGFVVEDLGDRKVRTVEGNLGDAVVSTERNVDELAGFVLWWDV